MRNYYKRNKQNYRRYGATYRQKHKEYLREHQMAWTRKSKYGIDAVAYAEMLSRQNGACLLCGGKKKLSIDHDHKTGRVRGILCDACNVGMGRLRDDPALLRKAAEYLE